MQHYTDVTPQVIEPDGNHNLMNGTFLSVPSNKPKQLPSPFLDKGHLYRGPGLSQQRKGTLLSRDLRMILQVLEAWITEPDTSGTLWPRIEKDLIQNLRLVVDILAEWHLSVGAGEPFWMARRGIIIREGTFKMRG